MEAIQDSSQNPLSTRGEPGLATEEAGQAERPRTQPFRRFRSGVGRASTEAEYLSTIQAELTLLREENARLRFERAQRPDAGSMIERLNALSAAQPPSADHRDEAWHLVGEALVLREVLIDICTEIGQTVITLQTRLGNLGIDLPDRAATPAAPERHTTLMSPSASSR
jgi:hypothetical protein